MSQPEPVTAEDSQQIPVEYFDRYEGCVNAEEIYGESSLRWAYETRAGRLTVEAFVKRALFSRFYGWSMSRRRTRAMVAEFIETYGIDPEEFLKKPESFESFNAFFIRKLKPEARPIDPADDSIVFPADGRHLGFSDLSKVDAIFAKGQRFDLEGLLGDADLAKWYADGTAVISRLCPVDYHRFHFCAGGVAGTPRLINGVLYSVNPIALRRNIGILAENKRVVTMLETERLGEVAILEIGATNVGSIVQTSSPGPVTKGEEKGYFEFGGSMTMLLFEPGRIRLADDLLEQSSEGRELYARMGDRLGESL